MAAAERAIELDESLAEAWTVLAHVKEKGLDLQGAKEAYRRSFELDSNQPLAHSNYAAFSSALSEHERAIEEVMLARALDPLSFITNSMPFFCLYYARRYDEAIRDWEKALELELVFPSAGCFGGLSYVQTNRYAEAIEIFRQAVENSNRSIVTLAALGHAFAVSGNKPEAEKLLNELIDLSKVRYVSPYSIALVYVGLDEKDKAIASLVAAYEETNMEIVFLNVEPRFDPLRGDPRFQDIIRRIGFPTNKTNQTDDSLEAQTVMLSMGDVTSEPSAKDSGIKNADIRPNFEPTTNPKSKIGNPKSKWWLLALLSLIILIGGFFGYRSFTATKQITSIAVLPFENKSSDADTDYLSDGLAESLIYRLSQIPNLKVSPTSSVFHYKGKETDPQIIAKELGVDSVLTGRIVQRGDNLTVSVNLVDTRNGKSLWGEQYERKMSELLQTQREIATEITNNLKIKLSGESEQKLAKKYTDNNEAYQLYLQGRFHFARRTKDDILKGIDYLQQAIKLDPNFALAYASIADSYNSMGKNADLPPKEVLPQAKAAGTRALEIDPTLAEAHGALADSLALYDWNWAESEREYGKAFQLDPNVSYIHLTHGVSYSAPLGKRDEAVAELKRAVELEPLSLITNAIFGLSYLYAGQNDKALEQGKRTYDLDPNFRFGRQYLGNTYIVLGRYDEAIALAEEGLKTSPLSQEDLVIAGLAYAKSGRRREAFQYLDRFRELAKTRYVRTVFTASIYAALGDKDKAFAELEKSFEDKDCFLPRITLDPFMDSLRDDPRFKDLMKRMNLPE